MYCNLKSFVVGSSLLALFFLPTMVSARGADLRSGGSYSSSGSCTHFGQEGNYSHDGMSGGYYGHDPMSGGYYDHAPMSGNYPGHEVQGFGHDDPSHGGWQANDHWQGENYQTPGYPHYDNSYPNRGYHYDNSYPASPGQ